MATTIGDNAVVIDFDDDFIRAGYAVPEREPGVLQPALVRPAGSGAGGETVRPIRDRRVEDWDQLEAILADVFYRQCAWVKGDEGACLITEPLFTSKADRERLTQMMFESFNVSGLYIAEQPVAALYAVGKVTGVSVDVGYSVTDVAPVVEGSVISPAEVRGGPLPRHRRAPRALRRDARRAERAREGRGQGRHRGGGPAGG